MKIKVMEAAAFWHVSTNITKNWTKNDQSIEDENSVELVQYDNPNTKWKQ
jgi:hypothetical protein